ncbi:M1 family metallopeptidase [Nocardioides mangrovi]|uniref:Aminopeptidase N n=1 Tax=Nocardioides mangrovi TaxID=2874580 RepID=A0ABS7U6K9_9ACTN|nr:M1 family metallopeptidase [Nocardioides mangrovi]MBZ5736530.1 M1 family metallopeptidase [Nocardioides mangrovi]
MTGPTADPYLPGHGDRRFRVAHYDLDLTYAVAGNRLDATAVLSVEVLEPTKQLTLDLAHLRVAKVTVSGGMLARYRRPAHRLVLDLKREARPGTELTVTVRYTGAPKPVAERHLGDAGWEELTDGVIVAAQPHGSPTWFPCNDRPDDKATYRIKVRADVGYHVACSGELVSRQRHGSSETWDYEQTAPMATYLATLQIGRYVDWPVPQPESGVPVAVVGPEDLDEQAVADALGRHHEMVAAFEKLFGPYPFPSYTVVVTDDELEIPLESQMLSTFGRNYVDPDWQRTRLVAHELAHQWFGNAVTLTHWRDIWLHEGFACYSEWLWSEESGQGTAAEHARHHWDKLDGLDQDLLLSDPGPELMFDDRVYKRGALALHALRVAVGDDAFFEVLRTWVADHSGGSVTTEQFLEHAGDRTGHDARMLLRPWLYDEALPHFPSAG